MDDWKQKCYFSLKQLMSGAIVFLLSEFYSYCGGETSDTTSWDTKSLHWNQTDDIAVYLKAYLLGG